MDNLPQLNDVERLSERVVRILGQNPSPYTLQGTNSYVIGTGAHRILMDTTSPEPHTVLNDGTRKYMENLRRFLASENAKISQVVITHRHYDHVGALGDLLRDAAVVSDLAATRCSKHESGKQNEFTESITWHYLVDGEQFRVDGATLSALFTPGHTDDHVSYLLEEENALFTGDTILGHGTTIAEHLDRYIETLQRLKSLNDSRRFARLYPAHGDVIDGQSNVTQKVNDYLKHRVERVEQVLLCVRDSPLSEGCNLDYLFGKVYPTVTGLLVHGAKNNLLQTLELLVRRGVVQAVQVGLPDGSCEKRWKAIQSTDTSTSTSVLSKL